MKRLLSLAIVAAALNLMLVSISFAATQGIPGATSTGTANINLTLGKLIRIRNMADISFPSYSGVGNLTANNDVIISVNYASGGYRVTGSGSGASNAFSVNAGANVIPYSVNFNDQTGVSGSAALVSGTALTTQTGAVSPLGSSTANANYEVKFLEADLLAASNGSYSGVMTLVVQPE